VGTSATAMRNRVLLTGEIKSVHREVRSYLRKKYRHNRMPVRWKRLDSWSRAIVKGLRPPRVISHIRSDRVKRVSR